MRHRSGIRSTRHHILLGKRHDSSRQPGIFRSPILTVSLAVLLFLYAATVPLFATEPSGVPASEPNDNDIISLLPTNAALSDFLQLTGSDYDGDIILEPGVDGLTIRCGEGKSGFLYRRAIPPGNAMLDLLLLNVPGYIDETYTVGNQERIQSDNLVLSVSFSDRNEPASLDQRQSWEGLTINIYPLNPSGAAVKIYHNQYGTPTSLYDGRLEMALSDGSILPCGIVMNDSIARLTVGKYNLDIIPEDFANTLRVNNAVYLTMTVNAKGIQTPNDDYPFSYRLLSVGNSPLEYDGDAAPSLSDPLEGATGPIPSIQGRTLSEQERMQSRQEVSPSVPERTRANEPERQQQAQRVRNGESGNAATTSKLWQKDIYQVQETQKQNTTQLIVIVVLVSAFLAVFIVKVLHKPSES